MEAVTAASTSPERPRILYADDQPEHHKLFARVASPFYEVCPAKDGPSALALLEQQRFAVIVSDFDMPEMNGVAVLSKARAACPDTVRVLLTGEADLSTAIDAINDGHLFRFLTKPCPPDVLLSTLSASVGQYELVTAQRVLLDQTLTSCVQALTNVLAVANPVAHGQSLRAKTLMTALAPFLPVPPSGRWVLEMAAMVAQIGATSLRDETVRKLQLGEPLSAEENAAVDRVPALSADVIQAIPRLTEVAAAVRYQAKRFDGTGVPNDRVQGTAIPIEARVLKVVFDIDALETRGVPRAEAFAELRKRPGFYDPAILDSVDKLARSAEIEEVVELPLSDVRAGMVFADDIRSRAGGLLAARGLEVTPSIEERIANSWRHLLEKPVRVVIRRKRAAPSGG